MKEKISMTSPGNINAVYLYCPRALALRSLHPYFLTLTPLFLLGCTSCFKTSVTAVFSQLGLMVPGCNVILTVQATISNIVA